RTLDDIAVQTRVLEREAAVGADHAERLASLATLKESTEQRLAALNARWEQEGKLVGRIREIRTQLEAAAHPQPAAEAQAGAAAQSAAGAAAQPMASAAAQPVLDHSALRAELTKLDAELDALQGDSPLMRVSVDSNLIGEVI